MINNEFIIRGEYYKVVYDICSSPVFGVGTSLVPVAFVVNYADEKRLLETWFSEGKDVSLMCLRRGYLEATANYTLLETRFSGGNGEFYIA